MTGSEHPDAPRSFDTGAPKPDMHNANGEGAGPEATAAYIADMTKELSGLARNARLETLAYLLDIAQLEANGAARHSGQGARPR